MIKNDSDRVFDNQSSFKREYKSVCVMREYKSILCETEPSITPSVFHISRYIYSDPGDVSLGFPDRHVRLTFSVDVIRTADTFLFRSESSGANVIA